PAFCSPSLRPDGTGRKVIAAQDGGSLSAAGAGLLSAAIVRPRATAAPPKIRVDRIPAPFLFEICSPDRPARHYERASLPAASAACAPEGTGDEACLGS